jgi:hypothetical protein
VDWAIRFQENAMVGNYRNRAHESDAELEGSRTGDIVCAWGLIAAVLLGLSLLTMI